MRRLPTSSYGLSETHARHCDTMNDPLHERSVAQELVGLAAIFSFLMPGLGHLLIGAWLRGAVWWAGWLVVPPAGGGGVHPLVVALMFIAGLDALLYGRLREAE
jgi:hypothetical protein